MSAGILDTGVTTDSFAAEERERWENSEAHAAFLAGRTGDAWARLAAKAARHAARLGLDSEALQGALGSAKGPPPGAVDALLEALKVARATADGTLPELPEPVGGSPLAQRITVLQLERELAKVRAWRRVATYAGRSARVRECGQGTVAYDDEGQLVLTNKSGVPVVDLRRCECRHGCRRCGRKDARKRARTLGRALHVGYEGSEGTPLIGVLTSRPPPPGTSLRATLDALARATRRWQRSHAVDCVLAGGQFDDEVTRSTPHTRRARAEEYQARAHALRGGAQRRKGEKTAAQYDEHADRLFASLDAGSWWHAHSNVMLIPHDWRNVRHLERDDLARLLSSWQRALKREWKSRGWDGDPGGMIRVEVPRRGLDGAAKECAKYCVKGMDLNVLDDGQLEEALTALDGRRLSRAFGELALWRRHVALCDDLGEPAYEGDGADALGFDEDEAERALDAARKGERVVVGRTLAGRLVPLDAVRWQPLTRDLAWEVHQARQRARRAWLASLRAPD